MVTARAERVTGGGVEDVDGAAGLPRRTPRRGTTPVDLKLAPGPHSIRIVAGGEQGPVHHVDVSPGGRYYANSTFGRPAEPRVALDRARRDLARRAADAGGAASTSNVPLPVRRMRLFLRPAGAKEWTVARPGPGRATAPAPAASWRGRRPGWRPASRSRATSRSRPARARSTSRRWPRRPCARKPRRHPSTALNGPGLALRAVRVSARRGRRRRAPASDRGARRPAPSRRRAMRAVRPAACARASPWTRPTPPPTIARPGAAGLATAPAAALLAFAAAGAGCALGAARADPGPGGALALLAATAALATGAALRLRTGEARGRAGGPRAGAGLRRPRRRRRRARHARAARRGHDGARLGRRARARPAGAGATASGASGSRSSARTWRSRAARRSTRACAADGGSPTATSCAASSTWRRSTRRATRAGSRRGSGPRARASPGGRASRRRRWRGSRGRPPRDLGARASPWRARLLERIRRQERGRAGAFLAGFLLGDRSGLDAAAAEDLRRIGGLHLLAISGMHVVLVAALVRARDPPRRARGGGAPRSCASCAVTLYCALAGGAAVGLARRASRRRGSRSPRCCGRPLRGAQALALARPHAARAAAGQRARRGLPALGLRHLGAARGGRAASRRGPRAVAPRRRTAAVRRAGDRRWRAQLVALPCLALVFGTISTLGLAANLLLVPVTNVALVAGLLALVSGAPPLWLVADAGALLTLRIAAALAARAARRWRRSRPRPARPACSRLVLAAWIAARRWRGACGRRCRRSPARAARRRSSCSCRARARRAGAFVVTALDVGQGDGLRRRRARRPGARPRRRGGAPGLRPGRPHRRCRRCAGGGSRALAAVVASHGDLDHAGGIPAVLRDVPADVVAGPGDVADTLLARAARAAAPPGRPRARELTRGTCCSPAPGYEIRTCGRPADSAATRAGRRIASRSCCSPRWRCRRRVRVLLTGDIDTLSRRASWRRGLPRIDVLKVAHHGSRTSSGEAFLAAIAARAWRVVSIGRGNRFGHPHADVTARFAALGIPWRATDREGALDVVVAPAAGGRARAIVAPARAARPFALAGGRARAVGCGSDDVAPHAPPCGPGFGPRLQLPRPRRRRGPGRTRRHDRRPRLRPCRQRRGRARARTRHRGRDARSGAVSHAPRRRGRADLDRAARARTTSTPSSWPGSCASCTTTSSPPFRAACSTCIRRSCPRSPGRTRSVAPWSTACA